MSRGEVVVLPSADLLAKATAARLVTLLVDAQAARGIASVVLTGGRVGIQVLRELRDSPARDAVDWARVDLWWGDERFVPAGDPERNDEQARTALLDDLPLDPARVHRMPAAESDHGLDAESAAQAYAADLDAATRPEDHSDVPVFDLVMLGVGEDGHTASVFPGAPALHDERSVVAVHDAPKPPPTRVSLTLRTLSRATEVWMIAAGEGKAGPVARALGGTTPVEVPAAGVTGRARTLWLLDRAAAGQLPTTG